MTEKSLIISRQILWLYLCPLSVTPLRTGIVITTGCPNVTLWVVRIVKVKL